MSSDDQGKVAGDTLDLSALVPLSTAAAAAAAGALCLPLRCASPSPTLSHTMFNNSPSPSPPSCRAEHSPAPAAGAVDCKPQTSKRNALWVPTSAPHPGLLTRSLQVPFTNFRDERQVGTFAGDNLDPRGTLMNYVRHDSKQHNTPTHSVKQHPAVCYKPFTFWSFALTLSYKTHA